MKQQLTQTAEKVVAAALAKHRSSKALIRSGKKPDQLLRSLIPLYVAKQFDLDLDSGEIARVWKRFRVQYAVPNAAKALREHVGYAKRTSQGRRITKVGIRYVEAALKKN
jgi:hypothetical protein